MPQFTNQVTPWGWTNQNQGTAGTLSPDVEQGAGASIDIFAWPAQNGYLGWTMVPEDAIVSVLTSAGGAATNTNFLSRVYVPVSGVTTLVDFFPVSVGSGAGMSNFQVGLYSASGTRLSSSTAITTFTGWATGGGSQQTVTWTTPTVLVAGNFYYISMITAWTGTAPTFAGTQNASAVALNADLTAGTSEAQLNGTAATLPASYTYSSGTLQSFEFFFALH